jgi:hypothetical protein
MTNPTPPSETPVSEPGTDPRVQAVADALMAAWFPNGHLGLTNPDLAEDYANWLEHAQADAAIVVDGLDAWQASGSTEPRLSAVTDALMAAWRTNGHTDIDPDLADDLANMLKNAQVDAADGLAGLDTWQARQHTASRART